MLRYIAYAWDVANFSEAEAARVFCGRVENYTNLKRVFDLPGLAVFAGGFRSRSIECYKLENAGGVVLGTLFGRDSTPDTRGAGAIVLDVPRSARIVATEGRELVNHYWGRYVAFIRDRVRGLTWVLQDPSSSLCLFRTVVNGIVVYFSDLADCMRATETRFSIDWDYVRAHAFQYIFQTDTTALRGIAEMQGGQCDEIRGGNVLTRPYWTPTAFARCRLENPKHAESALRAAVKHSVHTWAGCYSNWLHELSGGLDSSIALGCLSDAPTQPKITCLTQYGSGAQVDERRYARIAVEAAKCDWIQDPLAERASFAPFREVAFFPRPGVYLGCLQERHLVDIARNIGATVISSGSGGDGLFGEIQDTWIPGDYLRDHGLRAGFFSVVMSTAELTQTSVSQVLCDSMSSLWKRSKPTIQLHRHLKHIRLMTEAAIDAAKSAHCRYEHVWVRDARGLPHCKIQHIRMMSQPMRVRAPLAQPDDPEYVHPLATQLVIELCAAMPTYLLTMGGRTRAVAREAFGGDVPAELLARRSKGNPSTFVSDLIAANLADVRETLLDGELIKRGILDRSRLKQALSGNPTDVTPSEILIHASTERWVQQAQSGLRV